MHIHTYICIYKKRLNTLVKMLLFQQLVYCYIYYVLLHNKYNDVPIYFLNCFR